MNRDLRKAARALAGGRREEAAVYAWNALAAVGEHEVEELARIGGQLDDQRLLHELERRGLAPAPTAHVSQASTDSGRKRRALRRAWPTLAFALLLLVLVGLQVPAEPGPVRPTVEDTYVPLRAGPPLLTASDGVYLVPLGRAETVNLDALAQELVIRYRVPVGPWHELPLPRWTLDPQEPRLVGEQLIRLLEQSFRLRDRAVVIGITDYDMYSMDDDLPHTFSLRRLPHYGVVSTAGLGANILDRLRGRSRHERVRKLLARNIGFLYYRLTEIDDPHSLLRPQMSGIDDIDELDEDLDQG
ncbi:MAG: hypothetical protein ACRDN6_05100 [Gaiellaceae bacterium]